MRCLFCHLEIEEYIITIQRRPQVKVARRYSCPLHGNLHHSTLEPLQMDRRPLESEVKGLV